MDRCRLAKALTDGDVEMDVETRATMICRVFGAGSVEYEKFLEEVNSTLMGAMLDLPKFVPGDVKKLAGKNKKKKKHPHSKRHHDAAKTETPRNRREHASFTGLSEAEEALSLRQTTHRKLDSVQEEDKAPPVEETWTTATERKGRQMQKSKTTLSERSSKPAATENVRTLRRVQSSVGAAEQVTMDEQVALQLQTLVREKAELIKENSRLKNENEGLKTLLEYATCEATADDDEESDYETSKEPHRHPGIQAWHPPELQSPTSFSSCGLLGSTSSTEDKDPRESSQASDDAFHLTAHLST